MRAHSILVRAMLNRLQPAASHVRQLRPPTTRNEVPMDFDELYHFLFQTFPGIGCLVGIGLVLSILACIIMERRTRKRFRDRPKGKDDWSLFDDDDEEGTEADK